MKIPRARRTAVLIGLLVCLCLLTNALPAAAAASDTEMALWRAALDGDTPAEYGAYLATFPAGEFAELAKARNGSQAMAMAALSEAVATRHLFAMLETVTAVDSLTGENCMLGVGALVFLPVMPDPALDTVRLVVTTSKPGLCAAAANVDAPRDAVAAMLGNPTAAGRSEAPPAELLFWQSIATSRVISDYAAYLSKYPDGPFARLARVRQDEISRPIVAVEPPATATQPDDAADKQRVADEAARTSSPETETTLALKQAQWSLAQRSLNALGFAAGPADGLPGERTRRAIQQFQHSQSAAENGYFNQLQLTMLLEQAREPIAREDRDRAIAAQQAAAAAAAEQQRVSAIALVEQQRQEEADLAEQARQRAANWAAVYHDDKAKFYRQSNMSSLDEAKDAAETQCNADPGSTTCTLDVTFRNQCFSLARKGNGWGWAVNNDLSNAISSALSKCSERNGGCTTSWSWCSSGS